MKHNHTDDIWKPQLKRYPHIGKPLKKADLCWINEYVLKEDNIVKHKFMPLIHRTMHQRRFRPTDCAIKTPTGKRMREYSNKPREIYFASHLDSIIYSYYSHLLNKAYEEFIKDKPYNSSAVAYRKIKINNTEKGKCNIDFAAESFGFIEANKSRKLSVIIADVTKFFDNLNHELLKSQWQRLLDKDFLPDDHYAVYKNLIHNSYVNEYDLFKRFQNKLIVERHRPNNTSIKVLKNKKVSKFTNIRKENVVAFCSSKDFYKEAKDLIRKDKPNCMLVRVSKDMEPKSGIPQGNPISATLANIYMLDFDEYIFSEVAKRNGFYQRYSDDLIIICDQEDESYFFKLVQSEIEEKSKLEIQVQKTKIYRYQLDASLQFKGGVFDGEIVNHNKQLEYLGFTYNGLKVRVKSAGLSKFYREMKRSIRRGAHYAMKANTPTNNLYKTRLYKKYTHLGSKRRLIWERDIKSPKGYSCSKKQDWGNFISYLNKSNNVMKFINNDDSISRQSKKMWNKFQSEIINAECKIDRATKKDPK